MNGLTRFPDPVETTFDPRGALVDLLCERSQARDPLRGDALDQRFAHFSDLAFCDHATHARRGGKFTFRASDDQALLFAFGFAFEDWAAAALERLVGERLHHATEVLYALPEGEGVRFGYVPAARFGEVRQTLFDQGAVIGHPDFVLANDRGLVIDTKTALFSYREGERYVPTEAKPSDLIQTAAYAVALDELAPLTGRAFPTFALWMADKGAGAQGFVTYRTADFTALVKHGLRDLMALTNPAAIPPPPRPPRYTIKTLAKGPRKGKEASFLCGRCSHPSCPSRVALAPA